MGCCTTVRENLPKAYVFVTCVLLGISDLMPLNALTSAPVYMINYYKYVTDDMDAVPNSPVFWNNILTFYNVASVGTQIICSPTVLTPWARKLSLSLRFFLALTMMMLEVLVVEVMPSTGKVTQSGAMAGFFIATIVAGAGKAYLEVTCYAMVGNMPPYFMSAIMFGCGFSGVIASVLQCIIKASIPDDPARQAHIYFSLTLGIMFVALLMAESLRWNSFAQMHVGEYRQFRDAHADAGSEIEDKNNNGDGAGEEEEEADVEEGRAIKSAARADGTYDDGGASRSSETPDRGARAASNEPVGPRDGGVTTGNIVEEDDAAAPVGGEAAAAQRKAKSLEEEEEEEGREVRAVSRSTTRNINDAGEFEDGDGAEGGGLVGAEDEPIDQSGMTTAQQLQATRVWPVVRVIWPTMLTCFCVFFVSLLIFPSLVIPIDRTSNWFSTIAILCYNCGDATGRLSSSLKFLWPPRLVLFIISLVRFAFLPLIFLCIYGYIPGHAPPYVFMALLGLTNGFFGATCMAIGPSHPGLRTEGQRAMAGQLMGISLLAGASVSALLALLIVIFLP